MGFYRRVLVLLALVSVCSITTASAVGAASGFTPKLHVTPQSVTVGKIVTLWVTANQWPQSARVTISFISPHHAWDKPTGWEPRCSCFVVHVPILVKVHPPETAHAVAKVVMGGKTYRATVNFTIVGAKAPPKKTPVKAPTPAPASSGFFVQAYVSPSSMSYDSYPTLYAKTLPGAQCSASVVYSTGRSPVSFPGGFETAGGSGMVSWSWHEETEGNGGTAEVDCTYHGQDKTAEASFSVG